MLHTLQPSRGSRKRRKRVGRGIGSGHGAFSTRGVKGQQSRAGGPKGPGFEGGQTPLIRRQPKLGGFRSLSKTTYEVVNLRDLEKLEPGAYDVESLRSARLVNRKHPVKILGSGTLSKKLVLTVDAVSHSAKAAIEKAGGSVTLLH